ncbi:MAG: carboxypeptidase regulatory-like domain-containing protein, partial [Vicinamibacterales bacterium]
MGALASFVLLSTTVLAQGGATIAGAVKDTSGAVLPGVTVQVSSPALIERVRETVTDGTGQYRVVDLRPGTYSVTATLTGFNTFKRDNIELSGTGVLTINVDMKVGSIEETVTVSGETPVVDLQSTSRERVMSAEVLSALPTGRWYAHIGVLVPGVTSGGRDVGGTLDSMGGSLAAHGGSAGDQRITQNGLNVMTLQTGTGGVGGMLPNTSAAQEVAIDTTSASAERQTGGVNINFIPRDGGNTVRGSVFATNATEGQQASNFTQDLKDQGLTIANKFKANWDVNPGIGGPILKDKLWYYYTYRNNGIYNYAAGMFFNFNEFTSPNTVWTYSPNPARPALAAHGNWWDSQMRMTWQMNPKNKFAGTWDEQFHCRCPNSVDGVTSPEAAFDRRFPTQQLLHAEWWSPLTSKMLLEFVALHRTERWGNMDLRPTDQGGSLILSPAQYALYPSMIGVTQTNGTIPGLRFHGPNGQFNNNWVPNYTYRFAVSYITGSHSLKIGLQDAFGYVTSTVYLNTLDTQNRPVRYRFANGNTPAGSTMAGTPDQVTAWHTPYTFKNDQNHDLGMFIQDRWTTNRLTLNGGVRFDWYTSEVPPQTLQGSTLGRPVTEFAGILNTVDWKDVTPRIGASYDLLGNGKTAVKASLNKYLGGQALGGLPGAANPIGRLQHSASRNWTDLNGDKIVNCNLSFPGAQSPRTTG